MNGWLEMELHPALQDYKDAAQSKAHLESLPREETTQVLQSLDEAEQSLEQATNPNPKSPQPEP